MLRLIGLVQRSAAARRLCYIRQMNQMNSRSGSQYCDDSTINTVFHYYYYDYYVLYMYVDGTGVVDNGQLSRQQDCHRERGRVCQCMVRSDQ